jgi:hypothetical protein
MVNFSLFLVIVPGNPTNCVNYLTLEHHYHREGTESRMGWECYRCQKCWEIWEHGAIFSREDRGPTSHAALHTVNRSWMEILWHVHWKPNWFHQKRELLLRYGTVSISPV